MEQTKEQWWTGTTGEKRRSLYINAHDGVFRAGLFFLFFLGLAFWVGFLNRLTLEQETNGDGVDGMGCLQSDGCVALVLCRTKMKLSKDTLGLETNITSFGFKRWANISVLHIEYLPAYLYKIGANLYNQLATVA